MSALTMLGLAVMGAVLYTLFQKSACLLYTSPSPRD